MLNKLLMSAVIVASASFMANDANAFHGVKHLHQHHVNHAGRVAVYYPPPTYTVPRYAAPPVRSFYRGVPIYRPSIGVSVGRPPYSPYYRPGYGVYGPRVYGYRPGGVSVTIGRGW